VTTFQVLICKFLEYVKLVEMAMVQIMGSVEDERYFVGFHEIKAS
jgi:hypothetical protein